MRDRRRWIVTEKEPPHPHELRDQGREHGSIADIHIRRRRQQLRPGVFPGNLSVYRGFQQSVVGILHGFGHYLRNGHGIDGHLDNLFSYPRTFSPGVFTDGILHPGNRQPCAICRDVRKKGQPISVPRSRHFPSFDYYKLRHHGVGPVQYYPQLYRK